MTKQQLTALAALLGITPETHPHLGGHRSKYQPCGCIVCTCDTEDRCIGCGAKSCGLNPHCVFRGDGHPAYDDLVLPDLTDPGADLVWLAPMMEYVNTQCRELKTTSYQGLGWSVALIYKDTFKVGRADTITTALYLAAQAASVEGFEAPLEETNDDI